ncbi:hypothetical protein O6H91_05G014100 [Diphasiastrum complanatum]|uniref:Uncharacterized protein n=1 Tax=Diphasiastrum complanatum TaxID=34168 RepID=A0ACC2DLI1_DIPCM|nr:hypothetical protein O6H91_05G014100 [Diphasiastrum complanatum]
MRICSTTASVTPEHIRSNPSYTTPEVESRLEKRRRFARRRQAKHKVLKSLFHVESRTMEMGNVADLVQEVSHVETSSTFQITPSIGSEINVGILKQECTLQ